MVLLLLFFLTCDITAKEKPDIDYKKESNLSNHEKFLFIEDISEDEWIIRAIWLEDNGVYSRSGKIYSKLYEATNKKEYLFKEVSSSIYSKNGVSIGLKKLKSWSEKHPNDLTGRRLLMALYMNERSFKEAQKIGRYIISHSDKASDLELAANPYLYLGEYKEAVEILDKLYKKTKNENILIKIAAIEAEYLKNTKKAIQLLETYRRIGDASSEVYKLLIDLYLKEQNLDSILEIYRALYRKYPQKEYLSKIIEIYLYNRNFGELIEFLESTGADDEILYDLYKKENRFEKAKKLSEEFYQDDEDPRWLAEKAILIYEGSDDKDDRKVIDEVVSIFDDAFSKGVDDSVYLNYYGYTLIDKDIDIDKGLKAIEKALEQQPENIYYLDSLAWGYFKKGECLKAYRAMEKVVEKDGLSKDEIKEHWEKIQECQKPVIMGRK
jgi:tetratricopeptide (TPR) repeat protein